MGRRALLFTGAAAAAAAAGLGEAVQATGVPPWEGRYSDPEHRGCRREIRVKAMDLTIDAVDGRPNCDKGEKERPWSASGRLSLSSYTEAIVDMRPHGGADASILRFSGNGVFLPDGTKWTKTGTVSEPAPSEAATPVAPGEDGGAA